jgi:hypothetical protein
MHMSNELIDKIIQKAVRPIVQQRYHHTVGLVKETYYEITDTGRDGVPVCRVLAYNPYTGQTKTLYDVPVQAFGGTSKLDKYPALNDMVRINFVNGNFEAPVITSIIPLTEISDEITTYVSQFAGIG